MTYCLNPDCQQPQNPDDAEFCLKCGTKLTVLLRGRYRVERAIGQGGFGKTYLATDEDRLKARCVIKQFSPQLQGTKSLEKAVQLFEQEAIRLHELGEHPQIPTLLAYFEHDKRLYLVQQFIEGPTLLQEMMQQGAFGEQKIREVLAGILPILKFVHDHQVIHRDITPTNIIRRKLDNRLVLIDFGVAKLLSAETATKPGTRIGTEGYAPMEQIRSGKAYPASDLYSLAATCIYLLTQVSPEDLYDPMAGQWIWRQRLQSRGGQISEPIARILDRMLKDLVSERYQSADAVMRDLRAVFARPASGVPQAAGRAAGIPASKPPSRPPTGPGNSSPPAPGPGGQAPNSGMPPTPSPAPPPTSGPPRQGCLHTLQGHSRWVTSVVISPDGQTIASSGLDTTIKLWHLETGELRDTLTGHSREVNSLTISPDGQTLASASDDDTIKLWYLPSGKLLRSLTGHSRDVNAVTISPDGQLLASGSEDRSVILWKLATGEAIRTIPGLAGMIRSVAISSDNQLLASGGLDKQVKLWKLRTGELVQQLSGHFSSINTVVITPDAKQVISASKDRTIKIWDLAKGTVIRTLSGHSDSVNAIALSSNGKTLVSGSSDTTIKIWDLETGNLTRTLTDHSNAVNAVALSPDGRCVVSGGSDNTVRVWRIAP